MKLFKKIMIVLVIATIWLNIGWHFGTYYHENIHYTTPQTVFAKICAGGFELFSLPNKPEVERDPLLSDQLLLSITWPCMILFAIIFWIVYGIWHVVLALWQMTLAFWAALKFLGWFIFMGGAGELLVAHPWSFVATAVAIIGSASARWAFMTKKKEHADVFVIGLLGFAIGVAWFVILILMATATP